MDLTPRARGNRALIVAINRNIGGKLASRVDWITYDVLSSFNDAYIFNFFLMQYKYETDNSES